MKEIPSYDELGVDIGGSEEPVVADLDKALGQDMVQKAADKLMGVHGGSGVATRRDGHAVVGD